MKNMTIEEAFSLIKDKVYLKDDIVSVPYKDNENRFGGGVCCYIFNIVEGKPVFNS